VKRVPSLGWAALGVLAFSFTFPATALAEREFNSLLVGAGRSVIAAAIAAICLLALRAPLPAREAWPGKALWLNFTSSVHLEPTEDIAAHTTGAIVARAPAMSKVVRTTVLTDGGRPVVEVQVRCWPGGTKRDSLFSRVG